MTILKKSKNVTVIVFSTYAIFLDIRVVFIM